MLRQNRDQAVAWQRQVLKMMISGVVQILSLKQTTLKTAHVLSYNSLKYVLPSSSEVTTKIIVIMNTETSKHSNMFFEVSQKENGRVKTTNSEDALNASSIYSIIVCLCFLICKMRWTQHFIKLQAYNLLIHQQLSNNFCAR